MRRQFWHKAWVGFFMLAGAIGVFSGQGLIIAFGVMGLAAGGISWAWNRLALEEVSYGRELSHKRVFVGDVVSITVSVVNKKPVPLSWLRVTDNIPPNLRVISGDDRSNVYPNGPAFRHSTSVAWYERVRWSYRVKCLHRGLYRLGPARLESGDPFGFLRSDTRGPARDELLVYPRVVALEEIGIPANRPLGEASGGIEMFRDLARPSGIRDYQIGDSLKTVDWKATARAQRLEVRTYDPSSSTTVIVVVAVDTTTPFWAAHSSVDVERVIVTATSVASYAAEQNYSIGLFANDMPSRSERPLAVSPGRGRDQYRRVLSSLATLRDYAMAPMSEHLAEHARRFPMGSTLAVATAFLPPEFVKVLQDVRRWGHKVVVLYVGEKSIQDAGEGILLYNVREYLEQMEFEGEPVEA